MAEPRCDLRALVLNYRGADMTLQVVRDLLQMDDVRMSIVVIDNGSGAAEQARLRDEVAALSGAEHEVALVASDENLGFAAAMSRGLRDAAAAGYEFALVCNNDLRLPAASVRPLLDALPDS